MAPSAQYSTIYTTIIFLSVSCPMVPSSINSVFWFTVLGTDRLIGLHHDGVFTGSCYNLEDVTTRITF